MAWSSLLPDHLSFIEAWTARLFLLLAILTFGPWAALIVYDIILYLWRSMTYDIPVVGGRARGKARPRAPSLTERPDGHRRHMSLGRAINRGSDTYPLVSGSALEEEAIGTLRKKDEVL